MNDFKNIGQDEKNVLLLLLEVNFNKQDSIHEYKDMILKYNHAINILLNSDKKIKKKMQKILCDSYKSCDKFSQIEYRFFSHNPLLVNQFLIEHDCDSWTYAYIFKANTQKEVEKSIGEYGRENGIYIESDTIYSQYDCSGREFSYTMDISKVGKNLFLATKNYQLDV